MTTGLLNLKEVVNAIDADELLVLVKSATPELVVQFMPCGRL
jgi:hypothetical protein